MCVNRLVKILPSFLSESMSIHSHKTEKTQLKDKSIRISQLDGVRGCAILLILIWHYFGNPYKTNQIIGLFWSGVDLFFVLSGFLLTSILLENYESGNYFKVFYIRRLCRICPVYFLLLGIAILLIIVGGGENITWLGWSMIV